MDNESLASILKTGTPPAPGNLVLVEGFLNTYAGEFGVEEFATSEGTEAWLKSVNLWTGTKKLSASQAQKIIGFRDALRMWILDRETNHPINELVQAIPFHVAFDSQGEIGFRWKGDAGDQVLGSLIEVILQSQKDGTWGRFKCCELPTCGSAYYDSTRSRTKRWCSMKTCGSRHKAREYYKRKR